MYALVMEEIRIWFHSSSLVNEGVSHLDVYFPIPNIACKLFSKFKPFEMCLKTVMWNFIVKLSSNDVASFVNLDLV